jgi:hypothetical protein
MIDKQNLITHGFAFQFAQKFIQSTEIMIESVLAWVLSANHYSIIKKI